MNPYNNYPYQPYAPQPQAMPMLNHRDGKIFLRRMNNNGLMETQTYVLTGEQTKKTDTQEILGRLENIEKKLNIGGGNESTNVA